MDFIPPLTGFRSTPTLLCLLCAVASGQTTHRAQVCGLSGCYFINSSYMGGLRFEDYRVTNPKAIQFDPMTRSAELAQLRSSTTQSMCQAPPVFSSPAPTITFNDVQAKISYDGVGQSLDVQFSAFTASNGYANPSFGFTMKRGFSGDGTVQSQYHVYLNSANAGLQNVAGLDHVGFTIDPVARTALLFGIVPSSSPLRQAIFGVFTHLQSLLNNANFTTTNPPPSGKSLWTVPEIMSLVGQAQALISATADGTVPIGSPYRCTYPTVPNAYAVCSGTDQLEAFENMVMQWGGEYLGVGTSQSRKILTSNLLAWAQASAPVLDPTPNDLNHAFEYSNMNLSKPILMVWPTLRDDPALAQSDRQTIENWIVNKLMPVAYIPGGVGGAYPYANNWGYFGASVQMADAIRRSDHLTFANAIQEFYVALNQMRPDGSFPMETNRGACSGTYSNVNILHLTSIAEMAASQGYDLYSWSVNGKSLETAIEFLLNARENPALIAQYSKSSTDVCGSNQPPDQPDIQSVFNNFVMPNEVAWMEGYIARFPFSTRAARLRQIFGSDIAAPPFPMWYSYVGLNSTCAFRKSYEFQPVNGAKVAIVGGNGQTVAAHQPAPTPLSVRVTDNSGKALAGALVSFAVVQGSANLAAPAQVLTDAAGVASASVTMGPASGPVTVTATALGVPASFSIVIPGPTISSGGIGGFGASVPAVTTISPGSLFSIYGQNFVPEGAGRRVNPDELVNGVLPGALLGVCVSVGGLTAPIWEAYPGQINAVAPAVEPGSTVEVIVTTGCGTEGAIQSMPGLAIVAAASPEFLYFAHNANGQNPVEAVNSVSGAFVGPAELGPDFAPALPGDLVTIFASGLGPTDPPIRPGAVSSGHSPGDESSHSNTRLRYSGCERCPLRGSGAG